MPHSRKNNELVRATVQGLSEDGTKRFSLVFSVIIVPNRCTVALLPPAERCLSKIAKLKI